MTETAPVTQSVHELSVDGLCTTMTAGYIGHLAQELEDLPICTPSDIGRIERVKRGLSIDDKSGATNDLGGAYAWQRLPRFLDDFKETVKVFMATHPYEAIVCVDLGSAFPMYRELLEAVWFKKCGRFARRAVSSLNQTLEVNAKSIDVDDDTPFDRVSYDGLRSPHLAKNGAVRKALDSYTQIALSTMPSELSGEPDKIRQYLFESISFMSLFGRERLRSGTERRGSDHLSMEGFTMEEIWNIDLTLTANPDQKTILEMLVGTKASYLDPSRVEDISYEFEVARMAKRSGDLELAEDQRKKGKLLREQHTITAVAGEIEAVKFIADSAQHIADYLVDNGLSCPATFYSVDMAEPTQLVKDSRISFDRETLASALCRRATTKLERRDRRHIVGRVSEVIKRFKPEEVMMFTSFEADVFYTELPDRPRDLEPAAQALAQTICQIYSRLPRGGVYTAFPWDTIRTGEGGGLATELSSKKIVRERFLPRVIELLAILEEAEILIRHYPLRDIFEWMTPEEFKLLVPISPVFSNYLNADPNATTVPAFKLRKGLGDLTRSRHPKDLSILTSAED